MTEEEIREMDDEEIREYLENLSDDYETLYEEASFYICEYDESADNAYSRVSSRRNDLGKLERKLRDELRRRSRY